MKNVKMESLKVLKTIVDKEVNADKRLSSRCLSFFYQPKRNVDKEK